MSSNSVPRVFVVDDEYVVASSLASILKRYGYSTKSFTSPVEAFAAAQLEAPDLLLSAVAMRGLSGVDFALQVKSQHPECKVLLFSIQDLRNTFQLLQKPVRNGGRLGLIPTACELR